jgi:hypothetical protein
MKWTGHAARIWKIRNAYKILTGKLKPKRPLGRHRRENIIKVGLEKIG